MAVDGLDVSVDARPVIEMEPREVKFTDIAGVVHVPEEDVHILSCAKPCKRTKIRNKNSLIFLELREHLGTDLLLTGL